MSGSGKHGLSFYDGLWMHAGLVTVPGSSDLCRLAFIPRPRSICLFTWVPSRLTSSSSLRPASILAERSKYCRAWPQ